MFRRADVGTRILTSAPFVRVACRDANGAVCLAISGVRIRKTFGRKAIERYPLATLQKTHVVAVQSRIGSKSFLGDTGRLPSLSQNFPEALLDWPHGCPRLTKAASATDCVHNRLPAIDLHSIVFFLDAASSDWPATVRRIIFTKIISNVLE